MARFASLSEEELQTLLLEKDAARTRQATEKCWRVFLAYCREKNVTFKLKSISKSELHVLVNRFYLEARKPDGNE